MPFFHTKWMFLFTNVANEMKTPLFRSLAMKLVISWTSCATAKTISAAPRSTTVSCYRPLVVPMIEEYYLLLSSFHSFCIKTSHKRTSPFTCIKSITLKSVRIAVHFLVRFEYLSLRPNSLFPIFTHSVYIPAVSYPSFHFIFENFTSTSTEDCRSFVAFSLHCL